MEWTKENTLNTYIRFNTTKQKKKAIKFYQQLGYKDSQWMSVYPDYKGEEVGSAAITGNGDIIVYKTWTLDGKTKIDPFYKPRRKFPREMMVSNDNKNWEARMVYGRIKANNYPYITQDNGVRWTKYRGWEFAKEID